MRRMLPYTSSIWKTDLRFRLLQNKWQKNRRGDFSLSSVRRELGVKCNVTANEENDMSVQNIHVSKSY
jgi:hypothetical protein